MTTYSLSQLTAIIDQSLAMLRADTFWVSAEIASVTTRNGHGYMELVEKSPSGNLAAKMRATCWSNIFPMLRAYFEQETGQPLQAGMQVLLEVSIQFHAVYSLSLSVHNIDPTYTIGELARKKQLTLKRLAQEGLMDRQQQLHLPTLPLRLAVISSEQAAGYRDFVDELQQGHFAFRLRLFPALMQGDRAEASIVQALQLIGQQSDSFDAVVLIRGGGATTDLGCFDGYEVAAACALSPLPVLSGIGHTKDVSVTDQVVFMPLKTPTAVADYLLQLVQAQAERVERLRLRLQQTADKQVLIRRHKIEMLRHRLQLCSPERIFRMGYSLSTVDGRVLRSVGQVAKGQTIKTHLADGCLTSTVD